MHAHEQLVATLLRELPDAQLVETHISSVILSRDLVYKLKKPVDFGFLDYSTLAKRHHCALEELRSNRRGAPQLYLGLVTITGSVDVPVIEGEGEVIDYAVKMRRFEERDQLDHVVDAGRMGIEAMDDLAAMIAAFHQNAAPVASETEFGEPEVLLHPMIENFDYFDLLLDDDGVSATLADLKVWTLNTFEHLKPLLQSRKAAGYIRECHGDMHLHNMAYYHGELILFDAIEFNPNLSHIDVISDLAFLLMDLEYRGLYGFSRRLLNAYLEITGDYGSVTLLRFYKLYRAMVRAKVEALRAAQHPGGEAYDAILAGVKRYIGLARSYTQSGTPFLAITHGYSGSGKSSAALMAVEAYGAVRIRSDVERMRLFRTPCAGAGYSGVGGGIYTPEATRRTYDRLLELAATVVKGGTPVVVDATFLKRWQRTLFESLAESLGVAYVILEMACDEAVLYERVERRRQEGRDVSEADRSVLQRQIETGELLEAGELAYAHTIDCTTMEGMKESVLGVRA